MSQCPLGHTNLVDPQSHSVGLTTHLVTSKGVAQGACSGAVGEEQGAHHLCPSPGSPMGEEGGARAERGSGDLTAPQLSWASGSCSLAR